MLFIPGALVRDGGARPAYAFCGPREFDDTRRARVARCSAATPRGAPEHKVVWLGEGRVMPSTRLSPGGKTNASVSLMCLTPTRCSAGV